MADLTDWERGAVNLSDTWVASLDPVLERIDDAAGDALLLCTDRAGVPVLERIDDAVTKDALDRAGVPVLERIDDAVTKDALLDALDDATDRVLLKRFDDRDRGVVDPPLDRAITP